MGEHLSTRLHRALLVTALVVGAAVVAASPLTAAERNSYTVTPLVSDQPGVAANTDPNLVNAWGLTSSPTSPWWVSDNGTDKSTLYRGSDGAPQGGPLVVDVGGGPTGTVFNPTAGFALPPAAGGGKALFIFDSEDGTVSGWNMAQGTNSIVVADRSSVDAIYKGLAIANTNAGPRLYAADFHNARVDVFDGSFGLVPGGFVDPSLPSGYAPFGIQTIGDRVFVTYAKQDADAKDEIAGQSLGFVDAFSTAGTLLGRVAQHGQLNAPWGLALAPSSFGRFGGDLLVGNFGDGQINAYEELPNGHFAHRGELRSAGGGSLSIDGLWALQFGKAGNNGPAGTLFFTAGPDEEAHGLFGSITPG
jgi:uncharacterized protein (TIGR03118 family)